MGGGAQCTLLALIDFCPVYSVVSIKRTGSLNYFGVFSHPVLFFRVLKKNLHHPVLFFMYFKKKFTPPSSLTLISLITVEVGINVEGVQKLQNQ